MRTITCDRCGTDCTLSHFEMTMDAGDDAGEKPVTFDICPDCRADIICDIYIGKERETIGDVL